MGVRRFTLVVERGVQVFVLGANARFADHDQFLVGQFVYATRARRIEANALEFLRRHEYQPIPAIARDGGGVAQGFVAQRPVLFQKLGR